jgi:ADP-ribosylglycohydrolase
VSADKSSGFGICGRWAGMGSRPTWTWAITDLELSLKHPAWTFTDDTQMSLAIARAILSKGREPEGAFIAEVAG